MPFASFEEMSKQQIAIFERAMRMLTPFYGEEPSAPRNGEPEPRANAAEVQIEELRSRLNQIQKQLDDLVDRQAR